MPRPDLLHITDRQADVLRLVAKGLANHEIASELFLAESTVKGYVSEMLARHGLGTGSLVVLAYESGLVAPGCKLVVVVASGRAFLVRPSSVRPTSSRHATPGPARIGPMIAHSSSPVIELPRIQLPQPLTVNSAPTAP